MNHVDRDFERDEIEHLHEHLSYPRIAKLLMDMQLEYPHTNNWKLAARYGLAIYDLAAVHHWLFEQRVRIRPRVKRILRRKIRSITRH